jgi:hypothetical protein
VEEAADPCKTGPSYPSLATCKNRKVTAKAASRSEQAGSSIMADELGSKRTARLIFILASEAQVGFNSTMFLLYFWHWIYVK